MDRVKLGRALGYGTRHAAKTMAAVVEAAASPSSAEPLRRTEAEPSRNRPLARQAAAVAVRPTEVRKHARAIWRPLAVFSGALWLRVTGLFFALIAATIGSGAWRLRSGLYAGSPQAVHRFWIFLALTLLFAYFSISSFVRASLKERRGF